MPSKPKPNAQKPVMTPGDFRRLALHLEGAEEGSHMGAVDFRVGGRIFATLASVKEGFGNLLLTPEMQADYVRELPEVFIPVKGGWGRMGFTHVRLSRVGEEQLEGALRAAWKLRMEANSRTAATRARKTTKRKSAPTRRGAD